MRGNISIDPIGGHEGQVFKAALEDRFNPEGLATTNAGYHLTVTLNKVLVPSVVKSDGTIQRYEVRFSSGFKLYKKDVAAPVLTGAVKRSGSYNAAINANFATYEAGEDVTQRTLQEMAEDYILRITGYLASLPPEIPLQKPVP